MTIGRCKCGHRYSDHIDRNGKYGACDIVIKTDYLIRHLQKSQGGWNVLCNCMQFTEAE